MATPFIVEVTLTMGLSPNSGMLASQKIHSASDAFIYLWYDESYSEWSLCCAVVHNSCKKNLISAVSTSKGCNQAYISGRMCSEKCLCFSFTQLEIQTIFDQF